MTTTSAPAEYAPGLAQRLLRRLGQDTLYILVGFPLGLVTLVLCMVGFFFGVGAAIIWVGVPALVGTIMMARGFATLERARMVPILGRRLPHPAYKRAAPDASIAGRALTPLSDGQSWLDLVHGMFRFIPSTISFAFAIVWWVGALAGLTFPLWDWSIPRGPDNQDLPELLGLGSHYSTRIAFHMALGFFFAGTLLPVIRG